MNIINKKIIVADLDGTLAESKQNLDAEMSDLINRLLKKIDFAVISGGSYSQFKKQFLSNLNLDNKSLSGLYLLPTCGTTMYKFDKEWKQIYSENLTVEEKREIFDALNLIINDGGLGGRERFGEVIEDRGTQVTFSALGQEAPLELKREWDPDMKKRFIMKEELENIIPEFEIRIGGTTSIDVTKKGIDKAYGIYKIKDIFRYDLKLMLFIGDALMEGGNDYPVKKIGVECISVKSVEDSKTIFLEILDQLEQS